MAGRGALAIAFLVACGGGAAPAGEPRIDRLIPEAAAAGEAVEILGAGFGDSAAARAGGGFVAFGGEPAQATLWREDRVAAIVPPCVRGATVVVVTAGGHPSNAAPFRALAPARDAGPDAPDGGPCPGSGSTSTR